MKNTYKVINVFLNTDENEKKKSVNAIVKTLCEDFVEKNTDLNYNVSVALEVDTSNGSEKEVFI